MTRKQGAATGRANFFGKISRGTSFAGNVEHGEPCELRRGDSRALFIRDDDADGKSKSPGEMPGLCRLALGGELNERVPTPAWIGKPKY
jgi:hypothetical protein